MKAKIAKLSSMLIVSCLMASNVIMFAQTKDEVVLTAVIAFIVLAFIGRGRMPPKATESWKAWYRRTIRAQRTLKRLNSCSIAPRPRVTYYIPAEWWKRKR